MSYALSYLISKTSTWWIKNNNPLSEYKENYSKNYNAFWMSFYQNTNKVYDTPGNNIHPLLQIWLQAKVNNSFLLIVKEHT